MAEIKAQSNIKLREIMLHSHPFPKLISVNEKLNIIKQIIELTANDPAQGTKEWVSERQIGGSDTASVIGKGYYGKSFFEVVKEKIFPGGGFTGNLATRFGRVMEEFSRKFIEKLFSTEVWEFKSLPNQLQYTSYSPDGVSMIQLFGKLLMVLLEFKTPLSRIPDGKIPKEYLPQIKAGMCALPMVDGSLFISTMLRICNMQEMQYNFNYNTRIHKADITTYKSRPVSNKSKLNQIIGFGLCLLIQNEEQRKNANQIHSDLKITETVQESKNCNYIVFGNNSSIEEELFKSKKSTPENDLQTASNKNYFYRTMKKKYCDIQLPYNYNLFEDYQTPVNTNEFDLFKNSIMHNHEKDYGNENETTFDNILNYADKNSYISAFHIPPYIVVDNLAKSALFKESGLASSGDILDDEYITAEMRIYLIETLEFIRKELKKQSINIVGFIPYKVFKMDFIYQPNDDPLFMKEQVAPYIKVYSEIKTECNAIDHDANFTDEEKNKMKWDIIFKYFPDKKPVETEEIEDINKSLLSKLDDDFIF
jgi:hypothetical protein